MPDNPICISDVRSLTINDRVTVVLGATGCGKSSWMPIRLAESNLPNAKILCVQPRRVAAVSLAHRVARIYGNLEVGKRVGYRIRGDRKDSNETQIIYITAGYLRTLLSCEPSLLTGVTHILLDEAHERTIDSDFLAIMLRILLQFTSPLCKLVIMSATIDASLFVRYFATLSHEPIPVIRLSSRSPFEIEELYLEDLARDSAHASLAEEVTETLLGTSSDSLDLNSSIIELISELAISRTTAGSSTLVFLPGESAIDAVERRLCSFIQQKSETEQHPQCKWVIHVLHSLVPIEDQREALKRPPSMDHRHIVLSTNIAESSLTVEAVNLVIDTGLRREMVYDEVNKTRSLRTVWASKANIAQRKGRTGRVCNGKVIRLFTREFEREFMRDYEVSEAMLMNPSWVYLSAKFLCDRWSRNQSIRSRCFPSDPLRPSRLISELISFSEEVNNDRFNFGTTITELYISGILRDNHEESELTMFGSLASRAQLDPDISKMVYLGLVLGCLPDAIALAAAAGIEKDIFRFSSRYQPWREQQFAERVVSSILHRVNYDMGFCSDLIMMRNLLVSSIAHRSLRDNTMESKTIFAAPYYTSGVFIAELESYRNICCLIARSVIDWLTMIKSPERPGSTSVGELLGEAKTVLLTRENVDNIFASLGAGTSDPESPESAEWIDKHIRDLNFFIDVCNFRKKANFFFHDLTSLFVPLRTYEEGDILKLIITLSLGNGSQRVISADASFPRCDGEAVAVKTSGPDVSAREIVRTLTGGIEPVAVDNEANRVALVSSGFTEREVNDVRGVESSGVNFGQSCEYMPVTCSVGIRIILSVFEKTWKVDIGVQGKESRVFKPYIYNICRWMQSGNSRVYLSPRNPSGWLETRSGFHEDHSEAFSRNGDGRRRTLSNTYFAVVSRLNASGTVPHVVRADGVTILPIRLGGRVALAMLLCNESSVRDRVFVQNGRSEVYLSGREPIVMDPIFRFTDHLIQSIETVQKSFKRLIALGATDIGTLPEFSCDFTRGVATLLDAANARENQEESLGVGNDAVRLTRVVELNHDQVRIAALFEEIEFWFGKCTKRRFITPRAFEQLVSDIYMLYDHTR